MKSFREIVIEKFCNDRSDAYELCQAGNCPDCNRPHLLFYNTPGHEHNRVYTQNNTRMIQGGFYCFECGYSNAGAMRLKDYKQATWFIGSPIRVK